MTTQTLAQNAKQVVATFTDAATAYIPARLTPQQMRQVADELEASAKREQSNGFFPEAAFCQAGAVYMRAVADQRAAADA